MRLPGQARVGRQPRPFPRSVGRVPPAHAWPRGRLASEVWLLCQPEVGADPETKYFLVHLSPTVSLRAVDASAIATPVVPWAPAAQAAHLRDTLLVLAGNRPAGPRCRHQAEESAHLAPIHKPPPCEDFHAQRSRARLADPAQLPQPAWHLDARRIDHHIRHARRRQVGVNPKPVWRRSVTALHRGRAAHANMGLRARHSALNWSHASAGLVRARARGPLVLPVLHCGALCSNATHSVA